MQKILTSGAFDDMRTPQYRFLEEAAKKGELHVGLWSDGYVKKITGSDPKFPEAERRYLIESNRNVASVFVVTDTLSGTLKLTGTGYSQYVAAPGSECEDVKAVCENSGVKYCVLGEEELSGYPVPEMELPASDRKKVIVTGCYDWFHSGHVAFFEEASTYGDLIVVAGNDANVEALKGAGHPMFKEDERRYIVSSIKFVSLSLISTGMGWMDAEPEVKRLKPDIYVVNEDGDKQEKRDFCAANNLEYVVLKRIPKEGLPKRQSTDLRGF